MGLKKRKAEIVSTDDPEAKVSLQFFTGWMAAERGALEEARSFFEEMRKAAMLDPWAIFGLAFAAMHEPDDAACGRM